ncbi:hypothetical protein E2C01_012864 [Portunus trituberculatus]|uniref:Uncharacterized protein n=1 Tax=Portunus trituberculatus TaxID=210409 RepID=A0A5B7DFU3_PORTR|nr:hypothetical protein [Portunus trituberculatus]
MEVGGGAVPTVPMLIPAPGVKSALLGCLFHYGQCLNLNRPSLPPRVPAAHSLPDPTRTQTH